MAKLFDRAKNNGFELNKNNDGTYCIAEPSTNKESLFVGSYDECSAYIDGVESITDPYDPHTIDNLIKAFCAGANYQTNFLAEERINIKFMDNIRGELEAVFKNAGQAEND